MRKRPRRKKGKKIYDVRDIPYATIEAYEVEYFKALEPSISTHSASEIERLKKGDYINLKGYPFDNLDAQVISINHAKEKVKVSLISGDQTKEVEVSFDNIFFSVYENYDENKMREQNYEDLKFTFKKQRMLKADNHEE